LRGNTYDAKHLDNFLTSRFGDKQNNQSSSSVGNGSV